jgi:hypothetical protein
LEETLIIITTNKGATDTKIIWGIDAGSR